MRWTEKQIEHYLETEQRELTGSDGASHSVTLFRMYWNTYDAVRVEDRYTEAEIVDWAQKRVDEEGIAFIDALRSNLGLLDREFKRQNPPPMPSP